MIGNSLSDWIDDPRVVHGAVGNASKEFKDRVRHQGGYTAARDLTEGALELLERMAERSG
jgi:hypothetical protein